MPLHHTGEFESVKCPICQNIKEIEIMHVLFHTQWDDCDHSIKDYMNIIEQAQKQRNCNHIWEGMNCKFCKKPIPDEIERVIEFCKLASKETWGTLSTKIIKMLGGKP